MKLDPDLLGVRHLEEAQRAIAIEGNLTIGAVMANSEVMSLGEARHLLEEIEVGNCRGGVIGIVYPQ
jgi:hypothetical protein